MNWRLFMRARSDRPIDSSSQLPWLPFCTTTLALAMSVEECKEMNGLRMKTESKKLKTARNSGSRNRAELTRLLT